MPNVRKMLTWLTKYTKTCIISWEVFKYKHVIAT